MKWGVTILTLLCACGGESKSNDLGPNVSARLCTTTACAQSPCDTGCIFESPNLATSCPAKVETSKVAACKDFCGLSSGYVSGCWHHIYSAYCESCGPYKVECYPQDYSGVDYVNGGAICPSDSECDYQLPEDMAFDPMCDMSGPYDGGEVD